MLPHILPACPHGSSKDIIPQVSRKYYFPKTRALLSAFVKFSIHSQIYAFVICVRQILHTFVDLYSSNSPYIRRSIHSQIYTFVDLCIRRSIHSQIYTFVDLYFHRSIHSQIYTFVDLHIRRSTHSQIYAFVDLYIRRSIHSQIYTFVDPYTLNHYYSRSPYRRTSHTLASEPSAQTWDPIRS